MQNEKTIKIRFLNFFSRFGNTARYEVIQYYCTTMAKYKYKNEQIEI